MHDAITRTLLTCMYTKSFKTISEDTSYTRFPQIFRAMKVSHGFWMQLILCSVFEHVSVKASLSL